jgi:hypothetical protein
MELQELNLSDLSALHRKMNKGMMVAFINRHGAYDLDVRKSNVYYDEDMDFVAATNQPVRAADAVTEKLGIKYWSKGV